MQPQNQPQPEQPFAPQPTQGQPPVQGTYASQPAPYVQQPAPAQAPNAPEQFTVDYLNQIAKNTPVKKASPLVVFGLIGGILIFVIGIMFFLIQSAAPPDVSTQVTALQARLDTLSKVTTEQGKHLTQNELSGINSTLGASLTSMTTDLSAYAKLRGIKSSSKATSTETAYYTALSKKLDDAYLLGTLDRTYSTEMTYQLSILKSKMLRIKTAANSKTYNDFYTPSATSIDTVSKLLSAFQSTK